MVCWLVPTLIVYIYDVKYLVHYMFFIIYVKLKDQKRSFSGKNHHNHDAVTVNELFISLVIYWKEIHVT